MQHIIIDRDKRTSCVSFYIFSANHYHLGCKVSNIGHFLYIRIPHNSTHTEKKSNSYKYTTNGMAQMLSIYLSLDMCVVMLTL